MVGHSLPCIMLKYAHIRFNHSTLKSLEWFQDKGYSLPSWKENATEGRGLGRVGGTVVGVVMVRGVVIGGGSNGGGRR